MVPFGDILCRTGNFNSLIDKLLWHAMYSALIYLYLISQFCRDPETVLSKVQEIGDFITTIEVSAMATEVGVSIMLPYMLVLSCGNVQGVDISKMSAVSQQLSLVAEFQLKECAGEDVYTVQDQLSQCNRQCKPYRTS